MRLDEWYEVMARGDGEGKRNGGGADGPGPKRGAEGRRKDVAISRAERRENGKKKAEVRREQVRFLPSCNDWRRVASLSDFKIPVLDFD